jgi:hypothetical protein
VFDGKGIRRFVAHFGVLRPVHRLSHKHYCCRDCHPAPAATAAVIAATAAPTAATALQSIMGLLVNTIPTIIPVISFLTRLLLLLLLLLPPMQSLMGLLVNTIPTIIPVISFLAYLLLLKQPLSAAQAFTALSLFNILRFPLFQLPQIVTQVREGVTRFLLVLRSHPVQALQQSGVLQRALQLLWRVLNKRQFGSTAGCRVSSNCHGLGLGNTAHCLSVSAYTTGHASARRIGSSARRAHSCLYVCVCICVHVFSA